MAGKIKNVVETQFRSSGAQKTVKDTESIGRAQTRLGQNSASTGRQFSSQAQGLGGLVGAYAAAAANIFAITAAFDALSRAARAEQTIQGLNSLAATFGKTGDEILSSLKEITKGQLSTAELAQQANLALSAGLGNQLEGLTEVSLKASRALGRSLPDAFTRIIRGAGKLEPELLDELGIFTRIDPAVEKYALQTGKAASSLTNFERRQAFANAVLEEGQRKFSSINTTTATSAEKLEKLAATLVDIGTKIGSFVADVLAPFADFITDNLAAAVIAISFLIRQVLGSAFGLAANFVSTRVDTMVSKFSELSLKATASSQGFVKATQNISNAAENITPKKLLGGKAAIPGKELVTQIKAGQMVSPAEAKQAAQTLRELADAQTKNIDRLKDGGDQAIKNRNALKALANEIDSLPAKTTKLSTIYSLAFRQMTAATKMLGTAVSFLLSAFNKLFFFVTTIETFFVIFNQITGLNFSPLAKLAELFDNLNRKSKQFSKTIGEITTAFSAGLDFDALRLSADEVSKIVEESSDIIKSTLGDIKRAEVRAKTPNLTLKDSTFNISIGVKDTALREKSMARLNRKIDEYREKSKKAGEEGRKAFAILKILEEAKGYITDFGKEGFDAINLLSSTTGVAAGEFKKLFDSGDLKRFGSDIVLAFGDSQLAIKKVGREYDSFTTQVTTKLASARLGVNTFFAEFDRGVATAESAGQAVVKVENLIAQARESLKIELQDSNNIDKERVSAAEELIKSLEIQKDQLNEQKETLVALEDIQKKIKSNLSSDIKAFESAAVSGIIGFEGIAKTQEDQIENQATFQKGLLDSLTALKDIEAINGEDVSNRSDILTLENAVRDIVVSKLGSIIKISDETTKQLRDQEKLLPKLEEQLSILQRQTALKKQQSDIEIQTARDNLTQKALEQQINLQKVGVEISNINISKAKSLRDVTVKQQEALLANLESQKKLLNIENQRRLVAIEARNDAKSFALEQFSAFQEQFPDLFTEEDLRKLKEAQANLEFNNQMEILKEKRAQAKEEYELSLSILQRKEFLAKKEVENLTIANQTKINQINQEALISALENQKVANNIENNLNALAKNEDIIRQQRDIQIAQINLQAKEQQNSLDSSRRQLEVLTKQAEVNDAFIKSQTDLINKQIELFNTQNMIAGSTVQVEALDYENLSESVKSDLNKLSQGLSTQSENIESTRKIQIQSATDEAKKQIELNNISIRSLRQELAFQKQLAILQQKKFDAQIAATQAASAVEIAAAEAKVKNIDTEITAAKENQKLINEKLNVEEEGIKRNKEAALNKINLERDLLTDLGNDVAKILKDKIGQGIKDLSDAFVAGELTLKSFKNGFRDFLGSIFDSIRTTLLEKTVIKPVQDFVTKSVVDFFDLGSEKKGIENAEVVNGALKVTMASGDPIKQLQTDSESFFKESEENNKSVLTSFTENLKAGFGKFFEFLKGVFKSLGNFTASIFNGIGDFLNNAFGGSGGGNTLLGGLFKEVGGLFGSTTETGVNNAEVVNGALKVTMDSGDPIKQLQTDSKNFFKESDENNKSILTSFTENLKAGFGKFFEFLKGGFKSLGNFTASIFNGIGDFLNNAFGGPGGGSTLLGGLFKEVGGLFGSTTETGVNNAEVVNGALKVTMDSGDPIKQLQTDSKNFFKESDENNKSILASFSERLKADFGKFFEFLQGGFQNLGNFTSSIFSSIGNALNNAFGGSDGSSMLGSLFKGIGGLFGGSSFSLGSAGSAAISSSIPNAAGFSLLNSGGLVQQLAQGGYIKQLSGGGPSSDYSSSLVNRDRVPALLEPGEFVMRRQAVKSMGVSNMQAINSGTTPKVEVTIKNEGTPQEATSATPRFDVDKIVIDVVTRDLRNNGPIRKTLRGGGGV